MEKRQCKNCGAPLKDIGWGKYKCEYCGTEYGIDNITHCIVETIPAQCLTFAAETSVPDYIVKQNPDIASKMVVNQLSHNLAERIKNYMTIQQDYDMQYMNYIYQGRIRIIPESYKYTSTSFYYQ